MRSLFLPEGFWVAFLTEFFPSSFHVKIARNPDVTQDDRL